MVELGEDDILGWSRRVPGIIIVFLQVAADRGLQVGDRSEDAAADALAGHLREEAFHGIEPGPGGGVKWKTQRGWRAGQALTLGCLWVA